MAKKNLDIIKEKSYVGKLEKYYSMEWWLKENPILITIHTHMTQIHTWINHNLSDNQASKGYCLMIPFNKDWKKRIDDLTSLESK